MADITAIATSTAVKVCSLGEVVAEEWVGRKDATVADVKLLPSPQDVLNALDKRNKHDAFFAQMVRGGRAPCTIGAHAVHCWAPRGGELQALLWTAREAGIRQGVMHACARWLSR
jgi:hypothetical protein